jgi:hypothetical protein
MILLADPHAFIVQETVFLSDASQAVKVAGRSAALNPVRRLKLQLALYIVRISNTMA